MEEKPNYYAVIPATVRYDTTLKDKAKLLYGEITSLSNKDGYCFATNKYFADLYGVSTTTISLLIKQLVDKGYIKSELNYKQGTKEILNRYLKIVKEGYLRNLKEGIKEKLKDNNTSINNININIKENNKKKRYGEFKKVLLTDEEYAKLESSNLLSYIEKLDSYIASKGKRYKSHYATILNWSRRDNNGITPEWFGKEIEAKEISKEEQKELDDLLKEFGDTGEI